MKKALLLMAILTICSVLNGCSNSTTISSSSLDSVIPQPDNTSSVETYSQETFSVEPEESEVSAGASKVESTSHVESMASSSEKQESTESTGAIATYEENKQKHEGQVESYLANNNIDPQTAGETGEICPHCGKKIWNPDKFGFGNPGYPDNYENSGYCTGWCAVQVGTGSEDVVLKAEDENNSASSADPDPMKTYEENKKKHEEEVRKYLEDNNIDPQTAGETGETCHHCDKKIWNPNKYGLANPGGPEDYANSGYCYGTCGIQVG